MNHRSRLAPLAALLLAGCAGEHGLPSGPDGQADEASIRVTAFTAGTTIATLVVEVTGADIPNPLVFNLTVDEPTQSAGGTLRVKPGTARTFGVTAFDDLGEITHEGEATVDVKPGQNAPLQIKLGPRSGQVPVTISFGSFSVLVSPPLTELGLSGSAVVQLTAEVFDEDNDPVADLSSLMWATSNPAIASVNSTGLVTGLAPGSASIVATFEGVAGIAMVNVVGGPPVDADGDTFASDVDCDDQDPNVYPGAPETLNGVDDNCDGQVDEGLALNETDVPAEADYCVLQFATAVAAGLGPIEVYGQIFEFGRTEDPGASPGIAMEVGVAPSGASDPAQDPTGWQFVPAGFNTQVGNNDEYAWFGAAPGALGAYLVVVRFQIDGSGWTYCDTDGAGSNAGADWSFALVHQLTVE